MKEWQPAKALRFQLREQTYRPSHEAAIDLEAEEEVVEEVEDSQEEVEDLLTRAFRAIEVKIDWA